MHKPILLLPGLLMVLSQTVLGTSFNPQPFPDSVKEAPVVVRGKIGNSFTNWATGEDGARRIYTYYELALDESFKGKVAGGRSLMIREMGGEKDGIGMSIAGTAAFQRGEDVVVFLGNANTDGSYNVHGMMMGKYDVLRGEDGKEYLEGAGLEEPVRPELRGHDDLLGHRHGGGPGDSHPRSRWSLDSLRTLIRTQEADAAKTQPSENIVKNQNITPPSPSGVPRELNGASAAPQLQPDTDGKFTVFGWIISMGLAMTAGVAIFLAMRRARGGRKNP